MGSPVFLFWLLFLCNIKVFSAIWTMKYLFNISNKTRWNLHLRWNTWFTTYEYDVPYGDKKANCQVSDYKAWLSLMGTLVIISMPRIWKQVLDQTSFKIFHLHINIFHLHINNPLRKRAYSNILKNFTTKKWKISDKKFWYFSYFCSKHRLWVLVRTASSRRF